MGGYLHVIYSIPFIIFVFIIIINLEYPQTRYQLIPSVGDLTQLFVLCCEVVVGTNNYADCENSDHHGRTEPFFCRGSIFMTRTLGQILCFVPNRRNKVATPQKVLGAHVLLVKITTII